MDTIDAAMTKVHLEELNEPTLTLIGTPPPSWATNILSGIMIVTFLMPALALILSISLGIGPKLGLFIFMLVFGAIGYFLYRALHWNYSGREKLVFTEDKVTYQASSNKFKMEAREFDKKNISFESIEHPDPIRVGGEKQEAANLLIKTDASEFELKLKVPKDRLDSVIDKINDLVL